MQISNITDQHFPKNNEEWDSLFMVWSLSVNNVIDRKLCLVQNIWEESRLKV